jgi:hypothetical protein
MFKLFRRVLRILRYRRRWSALAVAAEQGADRATELHERRSGKANAAWR